MRISYNWIKQFLNINNPSSEVSELLTDLGLEVEGLESYQSVKGGLEGVVVGEVLVCEKHSNADKLNITKVDIGEGELVQIVCGAPNVAKSQKVAVAKVGTLLYDNEGKPWEIKKSKIRGEISLGMICAADELGLGNDHNGIMVLDANLKSGTPCSEVFEIINDTVFEIGLTPNRSDAMSHFGVARDLYAGFLQKGIKADLKKIENQNIEINHTSNAVSIEVKKPDLAPRYCGITLENVKVKSSPEWLQHRLKAIGLIPKNNIVDITNYILHDLGQPLHAFDKSAIKGGKIVVDTMPKGTKFKTLDGVERELSRDDLMICDTEKPLCIAGVFGGQDSGITEKTTSVFLESAYFDAISIRKTAKSHTLNTDASFRYERGIDPDITVKAIQKAAQLMVELADATIVSDIIDIYPKPIESHTVSLSIQKIKTLIGIDISEEMVLSILDTLEMKILDNTKDILKVQIPAYRVDVTRDIDIIEDIMRIYGYNNIPESTHFKIAMSTEEKKEVMSFHKIENKISEQLVGQGFFEIMNNSLTKEAFSKSDEAISEDYNVMLLNALSLDLGVMRQSLLYGGLETIAYNNSRKSSNLRLFEFGKTYHKYSDNYKEEKHLSLFVSGNTAEESWIQPTKSSSFFYLKSIVINIFERFGLSNITTKTLENAQFSEGLSFYLGKQRLANIGLVSSSALNHFDIKQQVLFADCFWTEIINSSSKKKIKISELSKFPKVRRDFALLIDYKIQFSEIVEIAQKTEKSILKSVDLFDVYGGKNLESGKKSYGVSFTFQDEKKTLTDKQINKIMTKLQIQFEQKLGASLR